MPRICLALAVASLCSPVFADGIFTSSCEHSTLTIHNNTAHTLTIDDVNTEFEVSGRTRGTILNLQKGQSIAPGTSHTAHLASAVASNGSVWGSFVLEADNHPVITMTYDFTTTGFWNDCSAAIAVSAKSPNYRFVIDSPDNTPVTANVTIF